MKKLLLTLAIAITAAFAAHAQKFAMVDMEYILQNVPQYEMANEQLNQLSQRWQREVEQSGK
ncbi:MAG: OmpH family outer membrane protein, partial [Muribaculaceae bacterium]|nr:OmpH family outer membrane protein [Muribaculaceae bacterium]